MSDVIKIFLASPGDVRQEREAFAGLVREINDTLTFLAPEKQLRLELIRYETHAFPDLGQPQQVINNQIDPDYDILVGLMWRRAGTPTEEHASGTIEEYERARGHRLKHGRPTIMFYFCDEMIPIPSPDELTQLQSVVSFRGKLQREGLTATYSKHEDFRETVRGGLLRAIKSIMHERSDEASLPPEPSSALLVADEARRRLLDLAAQYNEIRETMPAGDPRTRLMTALVTEMTSLAAQVYPMLAELMTSHSPGERLGAVAILQLFPNPQYLDWLADRLDPAMERPFLGFHAAVALRHAVEDLPKSECKGLRAAVERALRLAKKLPRDTDRITVLDHALALVDAKCR